MKYYIDKWRNDIRLQDFHHPSLTHVWGMLLSSHGLLGANRLLGLFRFCQSAPMKSSVVTTVLSMAILFRYNNCKPYNVHKLFDG